MFNNIWLFKLSYAKLAHLLELGLWPNVTMQRMIQKTKLLRNAGCKKRAVIHGIIYYVHNLYSKSIAEININDCKPICNYESFSIITLN